jgi:hypothetical protein
MPKTTFIASSTGRPGHNTIAAIASTVAARDDQRGLAPQPIRQEAHRQRCKQRRQAAGGHQVAQQRLIVAQAEHVKVEQQAEHTHRRADDDHVQQVQARIRPESPQVAGVIQRPILQSCH